MIVALPRAVPIPLPLIALGPTRLNLVETSDHGSIYCGQIEDAHRGVLQHVWDNEESDHTSPDVHLIKLGHTAVSLGHSNILQ